MEETYREGLRAALTEAKNAGSAEGADVGSSGAGEVVAAGLVDSGSSVESGDVGEVSSSSGTGSDGGRTVVGDEERPRDASGKFLPKAEASKTPAPKAAKPTATVAPVAKQAEVSTTPVPPQAVATPAAPKWKAPQAWTPTAREKWASLPEDIQAEVDRIERDTKRAISDAAAPKKFHQEFQAATAPYEAMIRSSGMDAVKYTSGLLQTAHALEYSSPGNKAKVIAQLVKAYSVPIQDLDAALSGEAPQGGQGQPLDQATIERMIDERAAQRAEAEKATALQDGFRREAAELAPVSEFWTECTPYMRTIMMAGDAKSLKDAYAQALLIHKANPESEVGKVLRQREAAEAATANSAATQRARAAATSVKSEPTGLAPSESTGSYRDELRRQMAERKSG